MRSNSAENFPESSVEDLSSCFSEVDLRWMKRALELARCGVGLSSPNPAVGCVVLDRDGALAGEGWHDYDRMDHAEVVALREAGSRAAGGTAYVTLEPCSHTGRTGPCADALIAAGVARVVAATPDPNPLVAEQGFQKLREAGVAVESGLCQDEAHLLNEGFARWIVSKWPFVHMKVAMTIDGRIAPAAGLSTAREPYWITGEAARAAVQPMRWAADAVITGVDTVIADDPLLTDRSGLKRRRPLLRVVLDSGLRIPLDSRLVAGADGDVLVCTTSRDQARICPLTSRGVRVEVLEAEAGRVSLTAVLDLLGAEGILTLLTETGARLNAALLAANHVDRLSVFCSPRTLGPNGLAAFGELEVPIAIPPAGDVAETDRFGEDFRVSALLHDPWVMNLA